MLPHNRRSALLVGAPWIFACTGLLFASACDREVSPEAAPAPPPVAEGQAPEWGYDMEMGKKPVAAKAADGTPERPAAKATLRGKGIEGEMRLYTQGQGVLIEGSVTGLEPGKHGIHVHEKGVCDAPDFKSAGGHFAPEGAKHGAPFDAEHHAGDFGNLLTNAEGRADFRFHDPALTLEGEQSLIGRAFIVHAGPDDLKSQPSGDAGGRVACGVIEKVGDGPSS